jgi:hypothetical protein
MFFPLTISSPPTRGCRCKRVNAITLHAKSTKPIHPESYAEYSRGEGKEQEENNHQNNIPDTIAEKRRASTNRQKT